MLKAEKFTTNAGVYLFKAADRKVLYVGKAANLASRLSSYFSPNLTLRQYNLVEESSKIETIEVDSEMEALLLEANLIKKFRPDYNVQLKDDKDYLYIKIVKEPFPRVLTARRRDLADAKDYFGPYPSARSVRSTLRSLRKIFPYRTCKPGAAKACFYYHLGLCPGVCIGAVSQKNYAANITKIRLFLKGQKTSVLRSLKQEMTSAAGKLDFEKAESTRKKIEAVEYITRPTRHLDEYVEANSIADIRKKELEDLAQVLSLKSALARIECYDISNFQGKSATGSLVVLSDGNIDKSQYRRFKIQGHDSPNDPAMMAEVLRRRLKNEWPLPDLVIVDGGKGQISAAASEIAKANLFIPVIGLAKRNEDIYTQKGELIRLPKDSQALFLLQRIRDEAHRFAVSYYRKLAQKKILTPT